MFNFWSFQRQACITTLKKLCFFHSLRVVNISYDLKKSYLRNKIAFALGLNDVVLKGCVKNTKKFRKYAWLILG